MGNTRGLRAAAGAALAAIMLLAGVASTASAAPPYETDATLTDVSFVSETVRNGSSAELSGSWSIPDDAPTPAGFVVDLPEELQGLTDAFPLLDDDGTAMGSCTVTATQIVCDLDSDYLAAHPRNVGGSFRFWVNVTTTVTETQTVTFTFGEVTASVTVEPASGGCPDCTWEGQGTWKWGWYDRENDRIHWTVTVPSAPGGMVGGETVTVLEEIGANQTLDAADIHLIGTDTFNAQGTPTDWRNRDDIATVTSTADGPLLTFTSEAGWVYRVQVASDVTDAGASGTYVNDASVTVAGEQTTTTQGEVVRQGGSGTGSGDAVGTFAITKDVIWGDAAIEGLQFEGTYTITRPNGTTAEGTFEVAEDGTWTSPSYVTGSTVHLEEIMPTEPVGITWSAPVFSDNDFELGRGATAVTLTNEATVRTGAFSAAKHLTGSGADLVAGDATFELAYSYPAGAGYSAGQGVLTLPADGTVVTSPALPVGAVVTLSEVAPAAVDGATWAAPDLSTTEVVIGADETVEVTVTNELTREPETGGETVTPTPTPTTTPVPASDDTLAVTGGSLDPAVAWVGLGMLVTGVALVALRRRHV